MISNETNIPQQTIDGSKIHSKTTDQSLQLSRFEDQSHHDKTDQSKQRPETEKMRSLLISEDTAFFSFIQSCFCLNNKQD